MTWLLRPEVMNSTDVRDLDKQNVFNTDVTINPSSPKMVPLDYNINNYRINNGINNRTRVSTIRPLVK